MLSKKPKGREVNATDEFSYNPGFSDAKMRIKINQVQLKETKEENKTTHERVAADRHYETQAAIVRIMKSRKLITHAELVAEVIKATRSRGVLEPADIKKNIEKYVIFFFIIVLFFLSDCSDCPSSVYPHSDELTNQPRSHRLIEKDYMEREEGNRYQYVA